MCEGILASLPALLKTVLTLSAAWAADRLRRTQPPPVRGHGHSNGRQGAAAAGAAGRGNCRCSTGRVRKLFTGAAIGPQAAMLAAVAMSADLATGAYQSVVLGLLVLTDGFGGVRYGGGASVNHLDIAPVNAGVIQGLKNTLAQLAGFGAPILLGALTPYPDGMSREQYEQQQQQSLPLVGDGAVATVAGPPPEWVDAMRFEWRVVFLLAAVVDSIGLMAYFMLGSGPRQWWDLGTAAVDDEGDGSSGARGRRGRRRRRNGESEDGGRGGRKMAAP